MYSFIVYSSVKMEEKRKKNEEKQRQDEEKLQQEEEKVQTSKYLECSSFNGAITSVMHGSTHNVHYSGQ